MAPCGTTILAIMGIFNVTLTFDPLTVAIYSVSAVTWSVAVVVPYISERERLCYSDRDQKFGTIPNMDFTMDFNRCVAFVKPYRTHTRFQENPTSRGWVMFGEPPTRQGFSVMCVRRIFPRVGNEGSEGWKSSSGVQRCWSRVEAPSSWRHSLKIMHKYFVYWDCRQHLQHKHTLRHF